MTLPFLSPATNPLLGWIALDLAAAFVLNLALWAWMLVAPPYVRLVGRLPFGALGQALPGLIVLRRDAASEAVLRHELAHPRQMRRLSPLGAALCLGFHYLKGLATHRGRSLRDHYHHNPIEAEARAAMNSPAPLERTWGWRPSGL